MDSRGTTSVDKSPTITIKTIKMSKTTKANDAGDDDDDKEV